MPLAAIAEVYLAGRWLEHSDSVLARGVHWGYATSFALVPLWAEVGFTA